MKQPQVAFAQKGAETELSTGRPMWSSDRSRHAVRKIVSYCYEGKQYLTLTHDLGLDGMSVENSHPLSKGERLNVRLILGKQSIRLKGRAVESRLLSGMRVVSDIRFTGVSYKSRRLLQNCLETLGE